MMLSTEIENTGERCVRLCMCTSMKGELGTEG